MAEALRLSIVIVSYECQSVLSDCLRSLGAVLTDDDEVIVVDNRSRDGTPEMIRVSFPGVRLTANDSNVGFAVAANIGVGMARGRLTLLLNPDTVVSDDSIERLIECLDGLHGDALIGPRLLEANGTTQRSAFRFPTPLVLAFEQLSLIFPGLDPPSSASVDCTVPVDWLKGACLLGPTALLGRYGPFDERFFMFSEDTDLCYRLHADGVPVLYVPGVSIVHLGGMSTRRHPIRMTSLFVENLYRYYQKHYPRGQLAIAVLVVRLVATLKACRATTKWLWGRVTASPNADVQRTEVRMFLSMIDVRPPKDGPPVLIAGEAPAAQDAGPDRPAASPVAQGSIAMLMSFVAMAALNYAFAITMSWLLPVEQFGAIGVGQAVLLTGATVVGAGFPWALARAVAQAKSREGQARAFRAALLGNCVLGLGLSVVVAGVAITGRVEPASIYSPILLIASTVIAVLALNAVLSGALQGRLLLRDLALVRVIEVVIKTITGLLLVLAGLGVAGAIGGFLAGAIVATAVAAVMLRGFPFGIAGGWIDRSVFTAAGPFFVAMVGFAVMSQMDILTLKAFTPAPAADLLAGQYQVAVTLGRIPYFAGLAVFGAIFPHVSRTARRSDDSRAYASLGLKYTMLFILPVGLILAVVPDGVIRLFFASRYDRSAEALAVVAMASVVLTIGYGLATLLQARGRQLVPAVGLAIAVPTQLVVAALAVPVLGMIGAAMSMGVAAAVALAVLAPSVIRSFRLQTSASEVLRYAAALAVLAGTLAVLPQSDRVTTSVSLAAATALYLVALTVLRLIIARDVETLGGAFGSRGLPVRRRIAGVIDAIQTGISLP